MRVWRARYFLFHQKCHRELIVCARMTFGSGPTHTDSQPTQIPAFISRRQFKKLDNAHVSQVGNFIFAVEMT